MQWTPSGGGAEPPGTAGQSCGTGAAPVGESRPPRVGVQVWPDGSRYEGGFLNGLKHGKGRYSWKNGEFYEGFFYKDFKHGEALYCWPTGHRFTGKFYLNRKEGYGQQTCPGGATFQGLFHGDLRFGPGVVTYADGLQDVGLWLGQRLLQLCSSVQLVFSLNNFPEYAAFIQPFTSSVDEVDIDSLSDESFILPPGIELYSTDGDHLPLPPGRRSELDRHFYGERWEPDAHPYQGYGREPLSTLPLQTRMQAVIHKHRLLAENLGWDVAAVLSMNRDSFGPKGPLEVQSELLIQHSFRGDLQAVSKILRTGLVHPDVADSQGNTALIAATVNCHDDVIHLLLNMGADIDKLNSEGMSALAVCHVLLYPFHSLDTTLTEQPVLMSPSSSESSSQISQVDFESLTSVSDNKSKTSDTNTNIQTNVKHLSLQTSEELSDYVSCDSNKEIPADPEHFDEERKEKEGENKDCDDPENDGEEQNIREDEKTVKDEERETQSPSDQMMENVEHETEDVEKELNKKETLEDKYLDGSTEDELREKKMMEEDIINEEVECLIGRGRSEDDDASQWKKTTAENNDNEHQTRDSPRSVSSCSIMTEEMLQHSAEALSGTRNSPSCDTQETMSAMAAMKIEHGVRLNTLKLLLERGADPNLARIPMPVLILAIMAGDTEAVRRLLLSGARTDIPLPPEKKGFYPLHVAAALPGPEGPRITELLLHAVTDPDVQACDQDEIYEPDRISVNAEEPLSTSKSSHLKEGGRTALHIACQRESDYLNASKVVALLLSHRARTDLLWSGHSPLSLAIASGNDLAVEELLNGGADPNMPLGPRVGSALCALANINYHLIGNRLKLLEMLAKAGANILMPVMVGGVVGSAVDYAHYSFNQDVDISQTPFHNLNNRERGILKARRNLLNAMSELLRQTAGKRHGKNLDGRQHSISNSAEALSSNSPTCSNERISEASENYRQTALKFCSCCGCSNSMKLTACNRCHKVFYCSRACKTKAWNKWHKEECVLVSGSSDGIKKNITFKPGKAPKPSPLTEPRTKSLPLSETVESLKALKPVSMMEEGHLKENYSYN